VLSDISRLNFREFVPVTTGVKADWDFCLCRILSDLVGIRGELGAEMKSWPGRSKSERKINLKRMKQINADVLAE